MATLTAASGGVLPQAFSGINGGKASTTSAAAVSSATSNGAARAAPAKEGSILTKSALREVIKAVEKLHKELAAAKATSAEKDAQLAALKAELEAKTAQAEAQRAAVEAAAARSTQRTAQLAQIIAELAAQLERSQWCRRRANHGCVFSPPCVCARPNAGPKAQQRSISSHATSRTGALLGFLCISRRQRSTSIKPR